MHFPAATTIIVLFAAATAAAEQVVVRHRFEAPSVSLGADGYAHIAVAETDLYRPVGKPGVPFRADRIELPADATDVTIEAVADSVRTNPLPALPAFGYAPVAVSSAAAERRGAPDAAIYTRNAFYPAAHAELAGLQREDGRLFAIVRVYPARLNPLSLACESARTVEVQVSYSVPLRRKATAKSAPRAATDDWTYLLVTTNTFAEAFAPLVAYKTAAGTPVHILDIADILADYPGADAAEKLRNAIRDGHDNHGTRYVLLGGGRLVVPFRKAYAHMADKPTVTSLVCDLYFACLDGSWDGNGNGVYGEPTDGEDGGDVDLAADVYVGRAPANSAADAANFVAKTLAYATNAHANAASALLAGEYLGSYKDSGTTYYAQGGNALDPLDECLRAYTSTWLDDRPQHKHVWKEQQAIAALNASPNLVAHSGHGERTSCMNMTPARLRALTNAAPFLLNSMACHPGDFTTSAESIVEACLNTSNAAFAAVLNTNYGWFDIAEEWLCSGEFMLTFFEHAVLRGESLGEALQRGKADLLAKVETSGDELVYRWCYFENTLFGDPQLTLQRPDALKAVNTGHESAFLLRGSAAPAQAPFQLTLFNAYDTTTPWAALSSSPIFVPSPASGTFTATDTNTVSVALAAGVSSLAAGSYPGRIVYTNLLTSATAAIDLALTVVERPVVTDSLGAADDGALPFDMVTNGALRSATITLRNADATSPLVLDHFALGGAELPVGLPRPDAFVLYDQYNGDLCLLSPTNGYAVTPLCHYYWFTGGLEVLPGETGWACALDYEQKRLVQFDLAAGTFSTLPLPDPDGGTWSGLAYSPWHRQLFAALTFDDASSAYAGTTRLYLLDPEDASLVRLGTAEGILTALAFDRLGRLFALDIDNDRILSLDPYTGVATGEKGLARDLQYSQGLDFDAAGRILYASLYDADASLCRLGTVDAATGAVTDIAVLGEKGQFELAVLPAETPFAISAPSLPLTLAPGASATLTLVCAPATTGAFMDMLGLHLAGLDTPVANLALSCESIQPSRIDTVWLEAFGLAADGSDDLADADGDGLTNYEEWLCGTSPLDAGDALVIDSATAGPGGFTLGWKAIPGLTYAVESAEAPNAPFDTLASLTATNSVMSYTDTRALSNAFYRVTLPAPPRRKQIEFFQ